MTERPQTRIGTVAEEAARLIEDLAASARLRSSRSQDTSPYAGRPAQEPVSPEAPAGARWTEAPAAADAPADTSSGTSSGRSSGTSSGTPADTSAGVACSQCRGERAGLPEACRLCPLCHAIAFVRSVRPEIVDQLADLVSAVAECLRDVAAQSRASGPATTAGSASGSRSESGRATQDIPVDDESQR